MPYEFRFSIAHHVHFHTLLESCQCSANKANGTQCGRTVVIGTDLCWTHLLQIKHLRILPSTVPNIGKGLFALDKKRPANTIIFKKNDLIASYIGETLTTAELIARYGDHTAPYCMEVKNNTYEDCALIRSYCSIANRAPTAQAKNSKFITNFRMHPQRVQLKATKNIYNGDEIFTSYGNKYRMNDGSEHATVQVRR